jgi:general secretion pathway protein K
MKNERKKSEGKGNQKGFALLTVLWVLTVLMVIVFSFSFLARTETLSAFFYRKGIENRFLAEAGIERGILELFYRKQNINNVLQLEGSELWKIDGQSNSGQLGDGTYQVEMTDESGKININTVPELVLRRLIDNLGVEKGEADIIVDSIMDWKDKDDLVRLNGAESDYYQSLPNPYKAKNNDFEVLEELLLVRGVTKGLFYGDKKHKGLIDLLTVQGNIGSVNINAAPKEILMAVSPGIDSAMADQIISYRQDKEIKNLSEIEGLLGQKLIQLMPLSVTSSDTFTIESFGFKRKDQSPYGIKATISLLGTNQYKVLNYKTPVTLKKEEESSP